MVFKPGTGFASSNYVANAKKLNPFRIHSMRSFIPHVGSFYSPTWGYQRHNSYRVAMLAIVIYNVKWCKLQGNLCKLFYDLIGIVRWLGIYCSTDYRLLYGDDGCRDVRWDVFHVVTAWHLCFWKPLIIRWWWMLCCEMRCFSCCNCVAIMLSKALHYTMMVGIVSLLEGREYEQLGTSCAFESPWLARSEPTSGMW